MVKNCKHYPSSFKSLWKFWSAGFGSFVFYFCRLSGWKFFLKLFQSDRHMSCLHLKKSPHCFKLALEVSFLFLPTDWVKIIHEIVSKWPTYQAPSPQNILFIRKGGSFVMMKFLKIKQVNFGKEWAINTYILSCIF